MAYTPIKTVTDWLSAIYDAVQHTRTLGAVRGVLNDLRVTVLNTVPVSGTVAVSAVTTVTTVTNQAQLGGLSAVQAVPAMQNTVAVLSNINNVIIS